MGSDRNPPAGDHLTRVLFGQTRQRVLGWLFGHPDQAFYLREIVRQTGGAQGAVQRELDALTKAGLVQREVRGRHVYFQADKSSPIYAELQSILAKTVGLPSVIRSALAPLSDRVRVAFIFGSAARNDLRRDSDVDMLVVGDVTFSEVVAATGPAQVRIGREVNPTVFTATEFRQKILSGNYFLIRVLGEPITFVIGGPDELERLGAKRVAEGAPSDGERDSRPPRRGGARSTRQRG